MTPVEFLKLCEYAVRQSIEPLVARVDRVEHSIAALDTRIGIATKSAPRLHIDANLSGMMIRLHAVGFPAERAVADLHAQGSTPANIVASIRAIHEHVFARELPRGRVVRIA